MTEVMHRKRHPGYDGSSWPRHDGLKWPHLLVVVGAGMVVSP